MTRKDESNNDTEYIEIDELQRERNPEDVEEDYRRLRTSVAGGQRLDPRPQVDDKQGYREVPEEE